LLSENCRDTVGPDGVTAHGPRVEKKYTSKQKRQAEHIEEGYKERGTSDEEAERGAWATVNKSSGGGKKSGGGRGKKTKKSSAKKRRQEGRQKTREEKRRPKEGWAEKRRAEEEKLSA
jgi:hypothetical protein